MTGPVGPDELRIGRREREAAVRLLGAHLAEGRLAPAEYEQRAGAALDARTRGDLRAMFVDLPPPAPPTPARRSFQGRVQMPEGVLRELASEGLLVFEEGLRGSITLHNFRAPGTYSIWERTAVTGTVALTWRRILVWTTRGKQVDVPAGHPLRSAIEVTVEKPHVLRIESDAGAFHPRRSGRIVYRLHTRSAGLICDLYGPA
jgi:hypothetical protein